VPWPLLFRQRVAAKVESSERYRWWVLWTVLAGLFSANFTFTVFRGCAAAHLTRAGDDGEHAYLGDHRADVGVRRGRARAGPGRRRVGAPARVPAGHDRAVIGAGLFSRGMERRFAHRVPHAQCVRRRGHGAASMALIFRVFHPMTG